MRALLVALLLLFCAETCRADDYNARRFMYFSEGDADFFFDLLGRTEVQSDLKLTAKKIEEIKKIYYTDSESIPGNKERLEAFRKKYNEATGEKPSKSEQKQFWDGYRARINSFRESELKTTLDAGQWIRLRQLLLQYQGPASIVTDEQASKAIGLDHENANAIKQMLAKYGPAIEFLKSYHGKLQVSELTPDETRENKNRDLNSVYRTIEILESEKDLAIERGLNESQREKWKTLIGAPLPIKWGPCYAVNDDPFQKK